ncbi:MAG TPA: tetratricopeptide repeat protein [Pyrinomonadaceae bacterium]|nr:tetratricopeptide repeat protein [Pyrinomonadaceae bacterium]
MLTRTIIKSCWIALVLPPLLGLSFAQISNHAEETVIVVTDWHPTAAHPIYLIAAPPQEKMAPRPLNVPIVSPRQTPAKNDSQNDLRLPFPMSAAQAVRIGNGLIEDSDAHAALMYLEEARKLEPNSVDVLTGLARCYYEFKRDDEALALYKEAIAQNAAVWDAQYYLGRIHLENGRYPQAVEALESALKLKPEDTDTISALGVALSKSGRSADAIPYLIRMTALKRYIKEDFYYLGEAYANDQQWSKAAQAFKEGADLRGNDPNGYFYWATMLFNDNKLDEALDGYGKVRSVDLAISQAGTFRYLAEIYRIRGMSDKALANYQSLLQREPNDVEALFQAGYMSFKLKQLDLAKGYFKKLMEVDPKHAGGAANFAALEARYNEIRVTRKEKTPGVLLREAVQANPNSVEAHVNLGAQLITEGAYPDAVAILEQAVSLRPNSAAAQYNLGLAQVKAGKYEGGVESNKKALELKPNWPDAYNNLGLAYAGLSRWEEAASAYREAVRLVPDYQGALYNLGIAYLRLGQKPATLQIAEKLRQINWNLQAHLWQEILATERTANAVAAAPVSSPTVPSPTPTPSPETSPPVADNRVENKTSSTKADSADEECPSPIYRRSDVTQMASMTEQVRVSYNAEAVRNKVEGRIVLQLVICSNGRVSDISIEEFLPFGLTEQTIEAIKRVPFQPALLGSQPVSVMMKQAFTCAQQECRTVSP